MKFEITGSPVKVGNESMISICELFSEGSQNNQVKVLDSGKDFVIITESDYSGYDSLFTKKLTKLCKVYQGYICLWRLCKANYILQGEYLYLYKLSLNAVLATVKPVLWLEVNDP